jgi:para-nitrobenzyl esterase
MGERDATMWAPSCPQIPQQQGQPFDPMAPMEGQEDCLTLNVWRPANAPADAALPVMVFVHGGGNTVGSASNLSPAGTRIYDGTRLAARGNVVVVTIQYRIGALGWLVHPALEGEMGASAGNLALLDQVAALRWVQRNIRSFRGDPARVMLFGESAGAVNTCALVASPCCSASMPSRRFFSFINGASWMFNWSLRSMMMLLIIVICAEGCQLLIRIGIINLAF